MSPADAARLELIAQAARDATADVTYRAEAPSPRRSESLYLLWYAKCRLIAATVREERASGINPWPVAS